MINVHWLRRDLRLQDNTALHEALQGDYPVLPIFIFDLNILEKLENKSDSRVTFIHQELTELQNEIKKFGSTIKVYIDTPEIAFEKLLNEFQVNAVFANRDYEPYAKQRDDNIRHLLKAKGKQFKLYKDHVLLEDDEVLKEDGTPYTVYTPYARKWKNVLDQNPVQISDSTAFFNRFVPVKTEGIPSLESLGFVKGTMPFPPKKTSHGVILNYEKNRDIPAIIGTSRLSLHLRFGTISIREKYLQAIRLSEKWINELIWRDFYQSIISHFPYVVDASFKPVYDRIIWLNDKVAFDAWCEGRTGYPLVDAGMRELNATGFMHNRIRMVTASFLTKHLLVDWRWGEAYFANKLLDFELASNNGGWQWASGSGVDAAPYFRIFNPLLQQQKFDPEFKYIKQWIPEWGTPRYPKPIIDHKIARERCLAAYKLALAPK